jgi:hypothetical protein
MSEEGAAAAADLETVRQLRAALAVAMEENDHRIEVERALRTELEAARQVVAAARFIASGVESTGWTQIYRTLDAYNATPKAPPMAPPPDWWWI